MGFHINVWNMPRIETYQRAKEEFESRTVVRGENQSVRRLGDRYEKEKWLRKEIQEGIEVYIAGYYDTDLVRFYPTHKEITLGGYPSTSTEYFVAYISGIRLYEFEHKYYVPAPFTHHPMVANAHIECSVGYERYIDARDWYQFDYNNHAISNNFLTPKKYRFDASQMRELRKPYRNLLKYIDTLLKINNEGVERNKELDDQVRAYDGRLLDLLADENNMYLAYYYLVNHTQHSRWHSNGYTHYCNIGMVKRYVDKLIKLENPQVLVEVN